MNTRILFIVLLLSLVSISVSAEACCTNLCTTISDSEASSGIYDEVCGSIVDGTSCDQVASCQDPGCCAPGDGSSCSQTDAYVCAAQSGTFYSGADCADVDVCSGGPDPIDPVDCTQVADDPNLRATHVLGSPTLTLSWLVCDSVERVELTRRVATQATAVTVYDGIVTASRPDPDRDWDTTYVYELTLYDSSNAVVGSDSHRVEAADSRCDRADESNPSCSDSTLVRCSAANEVTSISRCEQGCDDSGLIHQCIGQEGACVLGTQYLNVADHTVCEALPDGSCYYDRGTAGISTCYDCIDVSSCYEFKTQFACERANDVCPAFEEFGCEWLDTNGTIGDGLCKPLDTTQSICTYYNNPSSDARSELYSPILTPTTLESSVTDFSVGAFQCRETGPTCLSAIDPETCALTDPGTGYSCAFRDEGTDNEYCAKAGPYGSDYFADTIPLGTYLCSAGSKTDECETDVTPPQIDSIRRVVDLDANTVTYTPIILEDGSEVFDLDGYTFLICVQESCGPNDFLAEGEYRDGDSFVVGFDVFGMTPETQVGEDHVSIIVRDPGYNTGNIRSSGGTIDRSIPELTITAAGIDMYGGNAPDTVRVTASWSGITNSASVSVTDATGAEVTESISNGQTITLTGSFEYDTPYTVTLTVIKSGVSHEAQADFELAPPEFYITGITEPVSRQDGIGGGITGEFDVRVETNKAANDCRYTLTKNPTPPANTQMDGFAIVLTGDATGTVWTDTDVTRYEDGYLHARCEDAEGNPANRTLQIFYEEAGVRPNITSINYTPGTKLTWPSDDDTYSVTIQVFTDQPATCTYVHNNEAKKVIPINDESVFTLTFTEADTYTIPVTCRNANDLVSDPQTMTITVDPNANRITWSKPAGEAYNSLSIPYAITIQSDSGTTDCTIDELGLDKTGSGTISGSFNVEDHEAYDGDGTYSLFTRCLVRSFDETRSQWANDTTTYTLDRTAPELTVRMNGQSGDDDFDEVPSSLSLELTYSDDISEIEYVSYEVMKAASGSEELILRGNSSIGLGMSGTLPVSIPSSVLEQGYDYYAYAWIEDRAGNFIQKRRSENTITINPPASQCETGEICGQVCEDESGQDGYGLCGEGETCSTTDDCAIGYACIADECRIEHCYNDVIDKGEEELNCGGECDSCFISLVEPSFSISAEYTTDVVIETSIQANCRWGEAFPFSSSDGSTHTLEDFTILNGERDLNVNCTSIDRSETKTFTITHDPSEPVIEAFSAIPSDARFKSGYPLLYRSTLTAESNVRVLCRMTSDPDATFAEMTDYLGNSSLTNANAYSKTQNEELTFSKDGEFTIYTQCLARNEKLTDKAATAVRTGTFASPEPIVVVPEEKGYNDASLLSKVDAASTNAIECRLEYRGLDADLTRVDPSDDRNRIYAQSIQLGADGTDLEYTGFCSYLIEPSVVEASDTVFLTVDRTGPEIASVVVSDPYSDLEGVTNTRNAVQVDVDATDAISDMGSYRFVVYVDGSSETSGTSGSSSFIANGLNLSDGDEIEVLATAIDKLGNENSERSDPIVYEYVPPPESCSDGVQNGFETGVDCGGQCGPCTGPAPYCGDDTIDFGEDCDDGTANIDTCSADPGESCEVCTTSCTIYTDSTPAPPEPPSGVCGDGLVQNPNGNGESESCDDGTRNTDTQCTPTDGGSCTYCTTSCASRTIVDDSNPAPESTYCGDGAVQSPNDDDEYEACDYGSENTDTACTPSNGAYCTYCSNSCTFEVEVDEPPISEPITYCGDGTRQAPNSLGSDEQCDRGTENTNSVCTPVDGGSCTICTSACVEETYTDDTTQPPEPTFCGDGYLQTPNDNGLIEACDWGTENTDAACTPGEGETCEICTTSCEIETYADNPDFEPVCGNGKVETGEQCDKGNANRNTCTVGPGESCTVCTNSCEVYSDSKPGDDLPACTTTADCDGGTLCVDGTCQSEQNICTNGQLDERYETDVDCGLVCGPCDEGDDCGSDLDCAEDFYCSDEDVCEPDYDAICNNGDLDEDFETGVDCGDMCAARYGQTCDDAVACNSDPDCTSGSVCVGGSCVIDQTGPTQSTWCTADEFNNTIDTGFCGEGCSERCPEGVGCRINTDCESGLVCDQNTGLCADKATIASNSTGTTSCVPTDPIARCGNECAACGVGYQCTRNSDCTTNNCEAGVCRISNSGGPITPPEPPYCYEDSECESGERCEDGVCEEKSGGGWKWIIFFLLLILLGVAGFIAYKYYYLPNKQPDYQEDQGMNEDTMNAAFDEMASGDGSVEPPSGPPIMTEKQEHVTELIREKREQEKQDKRSELFSAFDESKLDEAPETVDEDSVKPTKLESTPDEEKPIVAARTKSHDTFKEILDDAKDDLE